MEPIAYDIGLRPWDERDSFWRMTPADFHATVAAHRRRDEREWYRAAWTVCYLLSPWSKKKLTPDKLLGRKRRQVED